MWVDSFNEAFALSCPRQPFSIIFALQCRLREVEEALAFMQDKLAVTQPSVSSSAVGDTRLSELSCLYRASSASQSGEAQISVLCMPV